MASRSLQQIRKSAVKLARPSLRVVVTANVPSVTTSSKSLAPFCSIASPSSFERISGARLYSSDASADEAINEKNRQTLLRMHSLIDEASIVNSPAGKVDLLHQYGDLRDLLINIYAPDSRHYITSKTLLAYLDTEGSDFQSSDKISEPRPLSDLLAALRKRELKGKAALEACRKFLSQTRAGEADRGSRQMTLREVFMCILDRNLQAGIGYKIICEAFASPASNSTSALATETNKVKTQRDATGKSKQPSLEKEVLLEPPKSFGVALGKAVSEADLPKLFKQGEWYASRKLDGVRCVLFADFQGVDEGDPKLVSLRAFTRTGRELLTLEALLSSIRPHLASAPAIIDIVDHPHCTLTATTRRIVLDGEVVVAQLALDDVAGVKDDKFKEDFSLLARSILRQPVSSAAKRAAITRGVENPLYFPFDMLPWLEFDQWKSSPSDTLRRRLANVETFAKWMEEKKTKIRALEQHLVETPKEVMEFMQHGIESGWEGLVLRLDRTYEGKRSTAVRKFKQWHDAEYVVEKVDVTGMRLPVDSKFEIRKALGNAWIRHKGTPVSIGSGFTVAERLRYGEVPEELIGKQVTVEYFGESTAIKRGDDGALSLRFPRVKKVWEGKHGRDL